MFLGEASLDHGCFVTCLFHPQIFIETGELQSIFGILGPY